METYGDENPTLRPGWQTIAVAGGIAGLVDSGRPAIPLALEIEVCRPREGAALGIYDNDIGPSRCAPTVDNRVCLHWDDAHIDLCPDSCNTNLD
jgi:hypothetical protein